LCAYGRWGKHNSFFDFRRLGAAHFAEQKILIVFCFCKIRNPAAVFREAAALWRRQTNVRAASPPERITAIVPRVARLFVIFYKFLLKYVRAWL
jgi:hypothetical protein